MARLPFQKQKTLQRFEKKKQYCKGVWPYLFNMPIIVFVWSQHDGGNVDKKPWLRFPPKPNDAKLYEYGKRLHLILTANADPMSDFITSVIVPYYSVVY